jgi:predicted GTPase
MGQTNKTVRIIVFGRTNVGKTSTINLLTNSNYETGNRARGCTFQTQQSKIRVNDENYIFYDTAGLNEANGRKKEAVINLIDLFKKIKEGINLIIYVRKCDALNEIDEKNFTLIMDCLTENKVPCLCVNTWAEGEDKLMDWWNNNKDIFDKHDILKFKDGVSVCCGVSSNKNMESLLREYRQESKEILWNAIKANKLDLPVVLITEKRWIMKMVLKSMNFILHVKILHRFSLVDVKKFLLGNIETKINRKDKLNKKAQLEEILKNDGFSPEDARDIIYSFDYL